VERRENEEVQSDEGRGRVAREREDESSLSFLLHVKVGRRDSWFEWDCCKSCRLAWFHRYAAKMDRASKLSLDGGFEKVEFAHGNTASGDDNVDSGVAGGGGTTEGRSKGLFKLAAGRISGDAEIDGRETPGSEAGYE
jgi:hypothetical protein